MRVLLFAGLIGAGLGGCSRHEAPPEAGLRIEARADTGGYLLTLLAGPGARVNARLKPALELGGGNVIRFDQPSLTADSGYFAAPPVARLPGRVRRLSGLLRVGICPAGQLLCRALSIPVDQELPRY